MSQHGSVSPKSHVICIKCAASIPLYTPDLSEYVGCVKCGALLDLTEPKPRVQAEGDVATDAVFVPGDQITLDGVTYLVLGVSVKRLYIHQVYWQEYALYHPDQPASTLSCSEGHWHFMQETEFKFPQRNYATIDINGIPFKRFANMTVDSIAQWGELHTASFKDARYNEYICPPYIASKEECEGVVTSYFGRYVSLQELTAGTKDIHYFPKQKGVGAAQPVKEWISTGPLSALTVGFVGLMLLTGILMWTRNTEIARFNITTQLQKSTPITTTFLGDTMNVQTFSEDTLVKKSFHIDDNHTAVELYFASDVSNNWVFMSGYLLHEQTGEKVDFWKEIQFYKGTSSDGNWEEGQKWQRTVISNLKEGDYSIVLSGESGAGKNPQKVTTAVYVNPSLYSNLVTLMLIALVYPIINLIRKQTFENQRWLNSDL